VRLTILVKVFHECKANHAQVYRETEEAFSTAEHVETEKVTSNLIHHTPAVWKKNEQADSHNKSYMIQVKNNNTQI